jgi:hypothetical protein
MKLYNSKPEFIIRLSITQQGYKVAKYINLHETTANNVRAMIVDIIHAQNLSPFPSGRRTRIDIREAIGAKNGKS